MASAPSAEESELVAALVETARTAWPELGAPDEAFVAHLLTRLPAETPRVEALLGVRAADLFLAFACARKDPKGLAAFDATFASEFRIVAGRVRANQLDPEDFVQSCKERLFAGERPKIAEFSGQGDLRNWLRVSLVRMLIDRARKRADEPADVGALDLEAPGHDPELAYLKQRYRHEFRQAFEDAARALSAEDRNALRYHYAEGLTVDQLAVLYKVHRATAARRVAKARDELLRRTRQELMRRLKLGRDELDSVMRMIESDVHISLGRVLASGGR